MALIWGSSFLFTELSLRFLPFYGVAFWRTFLGGVAMFGLVFLLKLQLPKGTQWFHLWVAGVLMSAIPFSLFSFAQQSTTSSLAAIIGAATPMFTLLAILTIYRTEKVTMIATIGLVVGLIGVAITLVFLMRESRQTLPLAGTGPARLGFACNKVDTRCPCPLTHARPTNSTALSKPPASTQGQRRPVCIRWRPGPPPPAAPPRRRWPPPRGRGTRHRGRAA